MVRFSDAELVVVRGRAAVAGLAIGAWIGQTVLVAAARGSDTAVGLPDLVRLHADVVGVQRAASVASVGQADIVQMLARLDAAIDAVVSELGRSRR
ncbi:hypothetical protein [Pseudonocardia sp.]|uniref:hypothetical protein n=1 Tax=Pseudonocardia sp. TaxID=60912 RepID=UPI0026155AE2|nr:hypothetical protein [Pseudonocardia sp.]